MSTEVYRIPRLQFTAEVLLLGQSPRSLNLFLGAWAKSHAGYERPSDLFNGTENFLPALDLAGKPLLLQLDAVQAAAFAADLEFGAEEMRAMDLTPEHTSAAIDIVLEDGTPLSGIVTYLLPEGQRRVQSFLNLPERFFVLRDGDTAWLINKHRILWVTPL